MSRKSAFFLAFAFCALAAGSSVAFARNTISAYSYCKAEFKGNTRAVEQCKKCVASGNNYNKDPKTKKWVCGMTSDMKKSEPVASYKPPPKPKAMPATASKYVTVPAGSFKIGMRAGEEGGSEDKEFFDGATITISRPFMMKTTEVTQGEWHFVMGDPARTYNKECGVDCPAQSISWRQALEYLNELSEREKLEKCYNLDGKLASWPKGLECTGYRLPTEAEWEYAARGGTKTTRYGELDEIAWYYDNSDNKPRPVGTKAANAYGLHDMLGSSWEWTWDLYELGKPFVGAMTDPIIGGLAQERTGADNENRILRGGSHSDGPIYVRAAHRFYYLSDSGSEHHGFRPVRTVKPKK